MIKLEKGVKPAYLTDDKIQHLKKIYDETKRPVWSRKAITTPLKATCFGKCAYCEKSVNGNGSYMEVDHFRCKDLHDDLVLEWDNFIPACKQCNTKKGKTDVDAYPIVNPYEDEPNEHFIYHSLRILGVTDKGKMNVELFGYNLRDVDARKARLVIFEKIDEEIGKGLEFFDDFLLGRNHRKLLKSKNILSGVLSICQTESEYSAITSTLVLVNPYFLELMNKIKGEGLWDDDLDEYLNIALSSAFAVKQDEYALVQSF
ncbi:HNH endonuclease [Serratia fonticola]